MADAEAFWTAARMESATPPPPAKAEQHAKADQPVSGTGGMRRASAPANPPAPATYATVATATATATSAPTATYYKGAKTIGVLYFVGRDLAAHSCTASVVHSPKGNLILTAAHCGNGDKYAFVPQYRSDKSAAKQPYGIWAVDRVFKDPRHTAKGPGSDLDFAFASLRADQRGRQIEQVTGANRLARTPSYKVPVTVIGYPKATYDPKDRAIKCKAKTTRLTGYKQLRMACGGFYGGTSGSPWLMNFDERTGTGDVVGNVGGWGGGGASAAVSYAPYYDDEVFKLHQDAVDGVATVTRPPLPYSPGAGETWQHARHLASGDYTGDGKADLIVVWKDGEVTLYTGDGKGGFRGERRLSAAKGTWKHATAVTGGDFTGSTKLSDLVVRWSDGEVTLYPDVSTGGFGREIKLARAKSVWKHASQITSGRFSGNKRADDLVVRWSDGEVTLHRDLGSQKLKKESRLHKPNATWKRATLLGGGAFTGGANWDLVVRRDDGELTLHQDVSTRGTGKKTRLRAPEARWKNVRAAGVGSHTANGRPDDLLVRRADGSVALYADTGAKLGAERGLVPPKAR
ncbi:trypsin-like serine peptidase [Streptomyces lasiicapitis]|uniref:trypsin-like serine peptidase n=1 Tax=Streptomyces lasiicapitis TaxID=1923961 RepID=UPI0036A32BEF